ncbi:MAG: hypothetical protein B6U94_01345 [Thermofilum sp. ex4484_79]|nr:MAG: hypothetical protein B6U94_01345 [Thermofilum sp. ex4484_79]
MHMYDFNDLLPYKKWRQGQLQIAHSVYNSIIERKILLINYPTGAGKTLPVLIGALKASFENGYKIIYLARTKNQFQAPQRELEKINKKIKEKINFVLLYNRQELCLQKNLQKLPYEEFIGFCAFLRKEGKCKYYPLSSRLSDSNNMQCGDEIMNLAESGDYCPYELTKLLSKNALVMILAYNYIFDPRIREIFTRDFNVKFERSILIIDEAHNLPDIIRNILTRKLRREWISRAIKEIKGYYRGEDRASVISSLRCLYSYLKSLDKKVLEKGFSVLERDFLYNTLPSPTRLRKIGLIIESEYKSMLLFKSSYIRRIYEFTNYFFEYPYSILYAERDYNYAVIKISPIFFEQNVIKPVVESRATIMMSGTLPPLGYYTSLLGLDPVRSRIEELRIPSPLSHRVKLKIVKGVSSRYVERGEVQYRKIAQCIDAIFYKSREGIVMTVFPSYNYMRNIRLYLKSRPLLVERERSRLSEVVNEAKKYEKVLLLAVAGGKMVEGIEIKRGNRSIINVVVIAGLPIPEPNILTKNMLENVSVKVGNRELAWKYVYLSPAVMRIVQAIGRSIRSKDDSSIVYILDERATDEFIISQLTRYGFVPEVVELQALLK